MAASAAAEAARREHEEFLDVLPIGDHAELMAPFLLDERREMRLSLRYVEEGPEAGGEFAAPVPPAARAGAKQRGDEQPAKGRAGSDSQEVEHANIAPTDSGADGGTSGGGRGALRAAARAQMAMTDAPWVRMPHKLDVARFESRQNSKWLAGRKTGDQSLRDAMKGRRSPYLSLVRLNEQMEVWVQLTGGGANRPLRIVIWADMAVLNQTTLSFAYRAAAAGKLGPLLLPPEADNSRGGGAEERRLRAESLSLLCHREPDGKPLARLALEMCGVNRSITRNQQIMNTEGGEEAGRPDTEGGDAPAPLQICEPNERLLLRRLKGLVSSPISTQSATYYGEAWLGGSLGVLGVSCSCPPTPFPHFLSLPPLLPTLSYPALFLLR
jgi:hypothetical protein